MATVRIASKAHGDIRWDIFADLIGLPSRWDAVGRMIPVWSACAETGTDTMPISVLDKLFGLPDVAAKLVQSGLAKQTPNGVALCGYDEHLKWLSTCREYGNSGKEHGKKGGRPRTPNGDKPENPPGGYKRKPRHSNSNSKNNSSSSSSLSFPESPDLGSPETPNFSEAPDPERTARELLAEQDRLRAEAIPGARPLKPSTKSVEAVHKILDEYTADDCRHVLAVYAAEARLDPLSAKWFNGETNWRPDNFRRALGKPVPSRAATSPPPRSAAQAIWEDAMALEAEGR